MKTLGIIAAGLLIPIAAMADSIVSPGTLVGVPLNFQSTTGSNSNHSTPFWNNNSIEGFNMNAGDFLTGVNPSLGTTDYLGTGFGDYLSTGGGMPDAPNFTFLQSAVTVQSTLLYTNSMFNYSFTNYGMVGTQIGLYNVANPNQMVTLYAAGTLYNPASPNGVYNNNVTPQSPVTANTWTNYGIYAYTCGFNYNGSSYCNMYYSDSSLNQATDPGHQHFALFENPQDPSTYYIGYEDGRGLNNDYEGYGDYSDAIFKLQTAPNPVNTFKVTDEIPPPPPVVTPEPATWSVMGLGLLGIGLLSRRLTSI